MNDKDKEAFKKWFKINFSDLIKEAGLAKMENDFIKAWQAAVDYKQKEIDDLKLEYDKLTDWASEYKAENAMLKQNINGVKLKQLNERIEELLIENNSLKDKSYWRSDIERLEAENAKLRECVEFYADLDDEAVGYDIRGVSYARQVLKEKDGK